jgi:hypothetical protein
VGYEDGSLIAKRSVKSARALWPNRPDPERAVRFAATPHKERGATARRSATLYGSTNVA